MLHFVDMRKGQLFERL